MQRLYIIAVAVVLLLMILAPACGANLSPAAATESEPAVAAANEGEPAPAAASKDEPAVAAVSKDEPAVAAASEGEPAVAAVSEDEPAVAAASEGEPAQAEATGREAVEKELEELDPNNFDNPTQIDNPWWPLKPGTQFIYEGFSVDQDEKVPHRIVVTVTDLTKVIKGVRTLVIFDRDYSDDQLEEAELAFFAQDNDGNVWHFGQYRETYDETEFVGGRVWLVDLPEGAKAGIMMQAKPQVGTPSYSQGYAPAPFNWTDRAWVYQMGQKTSVAFGDYDDVLVIEEFNEEEPDAFQLKYYARGVGNVRVGWGGDDAEQEELELVDVVELDSEALAKIRAEALALEKRAYMYAQTSPAEQLPGTE